MQKAKKRQWLSIALLSLLAIAVACLFIGWGLNANNFDYNFPRRLKKVAAIALCGSAIAASSLVFQTLAQNKVLTPSVMGLDSLYQFLQTVIVYFFGGGTLAMLTGYFDFFLSCILMVVFSLGLFALVFGRRQNLYILVLVGMVFGSFFGSLSSFMQAIIDPNEFLIVQGKIFASFNSVNSNLLWIAALLIGFGVGYILLTSKKLDVMALGREGAINLGVHYERNSLVYLIIVSLLVAVSTALVGPVTFLGVLVVNLARQMLNTHKHSLLVVCSSLISVIALVGGQFLVEKVFSFNTTVSVIVNFVGGIYFLFLLLRERKA